MLDLLVSVLSFREEKIVFYGEFASTDWLQQVSSFLFWVIFGSMVDWQEHRVARTSTPLQNMTPVMAH